MSTALLSVVLFASQIDDYCREHYGHPGDLGVTPAAVQYFHGGAPYEEIAVTIGDLGEQVPNNDDDRQVYRWQDGRLEMHFRDGRLTRYRVDDQWFEPGRFVGSQTMKPSTSAQYGREQADRRQEYEDFYQRVEKVVEAGKQVADGSKEQSDIRSLQFYLAKLRRAIDAGDWNQARYFRDHIADSPSCERSLAVAFDAPRRLKEQEDEQRRYRERIALVFAIEAGKPTVYESSPGPEPLGRYPYHTVTLEAAEQRLLDGGPRIWFTLPGGRLDPLLGSLPGPVLCADTEEALALLREWKEGSTKMPKDTKCHRRQIGRALSR